MKPVGVAVVGTGYWGVNLVRNFATLDCSRLLAVCDLDPDRAAAAAAAYPGVRSLTKIEEIAADGDVEAVVVATPAESHRAVAEAMLAAGKHVFVEKPLATSATDAAHLAAAAESAGLVLQVGHLFLYDPAVRALGDELRRPRFGDLLYLTGVRTSMGGTARLDTNVVWDALIHDAYVLPTLVGRAPQRVLAAGRGYLSRQEDVVFTTFDFGQGVVADLYASWWALEKARRITAIGTGGVVYLDELSPQMLSFHHRRYVPSGQADPQGRQRWLWEDLGSEDIAVERGEPLRAECQAFLEHVRQGSRPFADGAAGVAAVRVIEAVQASLAADGAWVAVES